MKLMSLYARFDFSYKFDKLTSQIINQSKLCKRYSDYINEAEYSAH